ncbi:hypothetical protein [Dactylosporangium darangshiense]|uniref:hypothetical protein n=1 Tax=Dactylosporangium darangshiense TaxID=579108 RepID=UPI00363CD650
MTVESPLSGDAAELTHVASKPDPVFVDQSGKRRRRIRFGFYAVGGAGLTYAALIMVSLAGGPLTPEALVPFPDLVNRPEPIMTQKAPAVAAHSVSALPPVDPSRNGRTRTPAGSVSSAPTSRGPGGGSPPATTVRPGEVPRRRRRSPDT